GYDHVDVPWAAAHGITVTNTPEVLTEEVADTALGLLLCTVREFPQAERFLRAGKWTEKAYPLTNATLRNRTVGLVGMGRIGQAIARRLEAMQVPVVYHSRRPAAGVSYKHYPKLIDMARDVDVLLVITPGGAATKNLINAEVLAALGRDGILINVARGSVVDEPALIKALQDKTIMSAGLDVYQNEPHVPPEPIALALVGSLAPRANAQVLEPTDAAKEMVGAWEISNAPRDKTCPVSFKLDPGAGGFKLELDEACGAAFPALKDVVVWTLGPNDNV